VLGEAEAAAGTQDTADLGEDGLRIADAAQHQAGDDGVGAGIGQVDPFGDDAADLEIDAAGTGCAPEPRVHVGVGLDGDETGAVR
jgi:hypothetical protein